MTTRSGRAFRDEDAPSPLLDLVEKFPHLFAKEVLERVDGDVINVLDCEHAYHKKCMMQLKGHLRTVVAQQSEKAFKCPICRGDGSNV
jgi:hypothetical protein